MRVNTLIQHRTERKIIEMSQPLVMNKEQWLDRGGVYKGTLSEAARQNFYTVWKCEKIGQPVTSNEFENANNFAMFKGCYCENLLPDRTRPCLPVFFRERTEQQ